MNTNKQTAVFNSMSTAADYNASGTFTTTATTKGITALYSRLSNEGALKSKDSLSQTK